MRKIILVAPALLVACATAPAAPVVVHGETPGHTCVEGAADSYVGKARSNAVGKAIQAATRAESFAGRPPTLCSPWIIVQIE